MQLLVKAVKASVDKKPLDQLKFSRQYLELYPHSTYMHYVVGWINNNMENWPQAICAVSMGDSVNANYYLEEIKKMTELKGWPKTNLLLRPGNKMGKYQEADEVLQKSWDLTPYYDHKHFTLRKKVDDLLDRG